MNLNSMLYWWPKVKDLGIPVPGTKVVPLADLDLNNLYLQYPVFVRTDLCAGKHDWEKSCFVRTPDDLQTNIDNIVAANDRWSMLGIQHQAIVVREFLELESTFTAFSGNMPINKERRYFVKGGEVVCHHPYWPEDAFDQHPARMANDPQWKEKLRQLNDEAGEEILTDYAQRVSEVMSEYWSVDFAKSRNGQWYLIDMALGHNSYHWPNCTAPRNS